MRDLPNIIIAGICALLICSCTGQRNKEITVRSGVDPEDSLLSRLQRETVQYFWEGAEKYSGMARERYHLDEPEVDAHVVTTGGSGFGLMALIVGIDRGFISREDGLQRFEKIIGFLETADRFHGAWPHWLDGRTGRVVPFSPKDDGGDLVETAFLVQGLLTVRQYFAGGGEREDELANRINVLWREVEWDWYQNGQDVLYWHWSPEHGWEMDFPVTGYNECLIMYVLAASSPTHPIDPRVYHQGWARNGRIAADTSYLGYRTVLDHYPQGDAPVGPLFWAHYSYLGLDPRKLEDRYANYWELNRNHALIHYQYCVNNPEGYAGYSAKIWGLTSSYSTDFYHGHRPGDDIGVISPTAALSSFPYTPGKSSAFLEYLYQEADSLVGKYGPFDAFSPEHAWYVPRYLAIDQGPIPVMVENHRTGLIWDLFMSAPEIQNGLDKLGFSY